MIIYRQKEFASTKESRKKSKEMNEKDKTRKVINAAQGATAVGGAAAIIEGNRLKKAAEKIEKTIKGKPVDIKKVEKMQKLGRTAKTLHKTAPYLIAASAGLGAVKIARDIKKSKKKKEIVLDSKAPKKMKGKESKSDLLKLDK
jgi:hypothetical protein